MTITIIENSFVALTKNHKFSYSCAVVALKWIENLIHLVTLISHGYFALSLSLQEKKSGSAFRMLLFVLAFLNDILLIKVITHYFVDSGNLCIYIYICVIRRGGCEVWSVKCECMRVRSNAKYFVQIYHSMPAGKLSYFP